MRRSAKIGLFLASYVPLFLLLALRAWPAGWVRGSAFLVLAALGLAAAAWVLSVARNTKVSSSFHIIVTTVKPRNEDVAAYAVTYLLPFLTVDFSNSRDLLALFGFLAVIGVLYIESNLMYLNPTFAVVGLRLYEVEYRPDDGSVGSAGVSNSLVFSRRRRLRPNDSLSVTDLSNDLLIETPEAAR